MIVNTVKCDQCRAIKQEANHWWSLFLADHLYIVSVMNSGANLGGTNQYELYAVLELCSESCLAAKEQEIRAKWLTR